MTPKRCKHPNCRRPARPGKAECHRCTKRLWRQRNPYRAAYAICKAKARQRKSKQWPEGIPWEITYAAFYIWARRTEYVTRKGNEAGSITIDRKDPRRGYEPGNLRVLTRAENARRGMREQQEKMQAGYAWRR